MRNVYDLLQQQQQQQQKMWKCKPYEMHRPSPIALMQMTGVKWTFFPIQINAQPIVTHLMLVKCATVLGLDSVQPVVKCGFLFITPFWWHKFLSHLALPNNTFRSVAFRFLLQRVFFLNLLPWLWRSGYGCCCCCGMLLNHYYECRSMKFSARTSKCQLICSSGFLKIDPSCLNQSGKMIRVKLSLNIELTDSEWKYIMIL